MFEGCVRISRANTGRYTRQDVSLQLIEPKSTRVKSEYQGSSTWAAPSREAGSQNGSNCEAPRLTIHGHRAFPGHTNESQFITSLQPISNVCHCNRPRFHSAMTGHFENLKIGKDWFSWFKKERQFCNYPNRFFNHNFLNHFIWSLLSPFPFHATSAIGVIFLLEIFSISPSHSCTIHPIFDIHQSTHFTGFFFFFFKRLLYFMSNSATEHSTLNIPSVESLNHSRTIQSSCGLR